MTRCHYRRARTAAALVAAVALSTGTALPALADDPPSASSTSPSASSTSLSTNRLAPAPLKLSDLTAMARFDDGYTGKWFVELEAQPTILGGNATTIVAQQEAFATAVADADVEVEETFSELWTGVVVSADEALLSTFRDVDHVKAIFPVLPVRLATETPNATPESNTAPSADESEPPERPTYTGKGVKIGIIDTGIDLDHTAFGGTGVPGTTEFPNAKIVAGYDFVGDDYNDDTTHPNYNPIPAPDAIPDDCGGHGTHVAGIAAGQDTNSSFTGAAPEATLGAYRVFGCQGSTSSDIILAAMERAMADGMDVVNMSLVADFASWPNYPTSVAADNLVANGINVVVAQGNLGEFGVLSGGAPASARDAIAVGAIDNTNPDDDAHVAEFSSWGVSGELGIRPDVLAPGTDIRSAYPLDAEDGDGSGYAKMSGTSMATPHVAGSIALLLEAMPDLNPAVVKTTLLNVASPVAFAWEEQGLSGLEPIQHQGAGAIGQIDAAWHADPWQGPDTDSSPQPIKVTPAKIDLGDGDEIETITLTITNPGEVMGTYWLGVNDDVLSTVGPNAFFEYAGSHDMESVITFSEEDSEGRASEISIPPGESRTVEVTIGEPETYKDGGAVAPGSMYGGFITVVGWDSSRVEVPFFGITGDYETDRGFLLTTLGQVFDQSYIDELGADPNDLYAPPGLASGCDASGECGGGTLNFVEEDYIFDTDTGDVPGIVVHIENPVRKLTVEAFHANDDGTKGAPVSDYGPFYISDGEGAVPFYKLYQWDATVQTSDDAAERELVESGRYVLEVTAIKGMGQATKGPNTESWVSPAFNVVTATVPPGEENAAILDNSWDGSDTVTWPILGGFGVFTGDWDGDGKDSLMLRNGVNFSYINALGDEPIHFVYGRDGDDVLIGDWDGDGKDTVAVRRGITNYYRNTLSGGPADAHHNFGRGEDRILVGDWDGDGKDSASVHRGRTFFVNNELTGTQATGFIYGRDGDIALAGDWDGNGTDTFALVRGTSVFVNNALQGGNVEDIELKLAGDYLLSGDWDGDGKDTLGVARSSIKG